MKDIVVRIDDDSFRRAEGVARARKISVSTLVEELIESVTKATQPKPDDLIQLFAALDKGRNTKPVGALRA